MRIEAEQRQLAKELEKKYPAVGSKVSLLINDSLIRYSGILHLVEYESVMLKPAVNHGTEGRYLAMASYSHMKKLIN